MKKTIASEFSVKYPNFKRKLMDYAKLGYRKDFTGQHYKAGRKRVVHRMEEFERHTNRAYALLVLCGIILETPSELREQHGNLTKMITGVRPVSENAIRNLTEVFPVDESLFYAPIHEIDAKLKEALDLSDNHLNAAKRFLKDEDVVPDDLMQWIDPSPITKKAS